MGSITRKIDDLIEEHGSWENYEKSLSTPKQAQLMNFRIVAVPKFDQHLLLMRQVNEEGWDIVQFLCYAEDNEGDDYAIEAEVVFDSVDDAKRFIRDYSDQSAEEFIAGNLRIFD